MSVADMLGQYGEGTQIVRTQSAMLFKATTAPTSVLNSIADCVLTKGKRVAAGFPPSARVPLRFVQRVFGLVTCGHLGRGTPSIAFRRTGEWLYKVIPCALQVRTRDRLTFCENAIRYAILARKRER